MRRRRTRGEVLIDFTENGSSAQGNLMYEANPGGAPCNVLAMLQRRCEIFSVNLDLL